MIATALACNPRLMIADEPTTALDVTVQAQIMALLAQLKRETGMAMIFITHDIGLVAGMADKVMVMQHGKAVEQGQLSTVLDQPQHPYTQHLLKAVPHFESGKAVRTDTVRTTLSGTKPILSVKGLTVRFPVKGGFLGRRLGAVHAVENVDLDLIPGETLAIVGRAVRENRQLREPFSGLSKLHAESWKLVRLAPTMRKFLFGADGFQNPYASLNPRLRIDSILAEPVIAAGGRDGPETRQKMLQLLDRVGLPGNSLERYPHEFSGGQRQRLCIARALMLNPAVVVLDEAVSALDVSVQAKVLDLLIDLQKERGLAYLFVSHDMAVVERIAHRIAVVYAGQIVEIGDAATILSAPKHSYTKRLISAVPSIDRRNEHFALDTRQVPSLVRPLGYEPEPANWQTYGRDHMARTEA